jgi:hypothetical protein
MDEATWARTSIGEVSQTPPSKPTWLERGRHWARSTTFKTWPVFVLVVLVVGGILVANVMVLERERFNYVLSRASELKQLDTSHNSIRRWIAGSKEEGSRHPRRDASTQRAVMPGPGMPTGSFHWTYPRISGKGKVDPPAKLAGTHRRRAGPRGNFLRLPVGVATTLMRQRLKEEEKQGVDFQRKIDWTLLKTLEQQVQDTAFLSSSPQHAFAHLQKLLRWANDAGVVTEVRAPRLL